jgi:hypothetical protein
MKEIHRANTTKIASSGAGYSTRPERLNSTMISGMPKTLRRGTYPVALGETASVLFTPP